MKQAVLVPLAVLCLCVPAFGAVPYEAVSAGWGDSCRGRRSLLYFTEWVARDGVIETSRVAYTVAAAPGGRVFGGNWSDTNVPAVHVNEIGLNGFSRRVSVDVPVGGNGFPYALAVDARGNMYVLVDSPSAFGHAEIAAIDRTGALRARYPLGPMAVDGATIDLAADQCTLFIGAPDGVRRLNVCSGTSLPPFPAAGQVVRVLPDGGLLVTHMGAPIRRYSAEGLLVRTYAVSQLITAIALVNNGTAAWYAVPCSEVFVELDLETGATRTVAPTEAVEPNSIVPYHGWSAALGAFHLATVPALSPATLMALAILLVALALIRMR